MEVEMGVNWVLWNVQIHQHLKAKQSKNRRKSKRHVKENESSGEARATTAVGHTTASGGCHGQAVVSPTALVARVFPGCSFSFACLFDFRRFLLCFAFKY